MFVNNSHSMPLVMVGQTPGFGDLSAVVACEKYKIKSQNDTVALESAKVFLAIACSTTSSAV